MTTVSSVVMTDRMPASDRMEDVETPVTPRASRFNASITVPTEKIPGVEIAHIDEPDGPGPAVETTDSPPPTPRNAPQKNESMPANVDPPSQSSAMDLDDSEDEKSGSDHEGENDDGDAASRKKKGQRFFCTGYPPCSLSFTRSEHLARHIRKHTGERPFQCHCNRRFSRLDNLRQHAQTVHVNEEIPTDSLAATGTRFQRQIRTDRVRPAGRSRTSTMSSTGSHSRGHSRNLSTSSIGSTSSNYSTATEVRRRPPPLLMANDNSLRPDFDSDVPNTPPGQMRNFVTDSPSGLTTPTSITFSAASGSPAYASSLGSPANGGPRPGMFLGNRTPARRLSVPATPPPLYPSGGTQPYAYGPHYGQPSSEMSSGRNGITSPTNSNFPYSPGHHYSATEDWRRRTWHPSTYTASNFNYGRPATSGLTYSQTPDAPQPAYAHHATAAAGQAPRLPGIESFDHVRNHNSTPPRRPNSPGNVQIEQQSEPNGPLLGLGFHPGHRPGQMSWQGPARPYNEGDVSKVSRDAITWGQQTIHDIRNVGYGQPPPEMRRGDMGPPSYSGQQQHRHQQIAREALDFQQQNGPPKRHGWNEGPRAAIRTSPEDSSSSEGIPTPNTSVVDVHPMIMQNSGYMDGHQFPVGTDVHHATCLPSAEQIMPHFPNPLERQRTASISDRGGSADMNRLEALVAVATGDSSASGVSRI